MTKAPKKPDPMIVAYEEYQALCGTLGLTACEINQWNISTLIGGLREGEHIPYLTSIGTVWVRNLKHKTSRKDLPYEVFAGRALGMKGYS